MTKTIRVAIDGPSGAGKSTLARSAAARLGYLYVDTGASYRTIGCAARRRSTQGWLWPLPPQKSPTPAPGRPVSGRALPVRSGGNMSASAWAASGMKQRSAGTGKLM